MTSEQMYTPTGTSFTTLFSRDRGEYPRLGRLTFNTSGRTHMGVFNLAHFTVYHAVETNPRLAPALAKPSFNLRTDFSGGGLKPPLAVDVSKYGKDMTVGVSTPSHQLSIDCYDGKVRVRQGLGRGANYEIYPAQVDGLYRVHVLPRDVERRLGQLPSDVLTNTGAATAAIFGDIEADLVRAARNGLRQESRLT